MFPDTTLSSRISWKGHLFLLSFLPSLTASFRGQKKRKTILSSSTSSLYTRVVKIVETVMAIHVQRER